MQNFIDRSPENNGSNPLDPFIKDQIEYLRDIWYACKPGDFHFPYTFSNEEKLTNEEMIKDTLSWVKPKLQDAHISVAERQDFIHSATQKLKTIAMEVFRLSEPQVKVVEELGKERVSVEFFHRAREFDPMIKVSDIIQAARNISIANSQQKLLGKSTELTPALFAYSMLYPVSDNFLDDPLYSRKDKEAFNQKFRSWLKGEEVDAQNAKETQIQKLIRIIEAQYPRHEFPQVYDGLLAIHTAQDKSMHLPHGSNTPYSIDLLGLSFEKGGTAVLADGILAGGVVTRPQMEIFFHFGAFTQLMDDHEDLTQDLSHGSLTVFTEAARAGKIDHTMKRLFSFSHEVLKGLRCFPDEKMRPLIEVANNDLSLILIFEILANEKYYSRLYLEELETHFPFRFTFVKKVLKNLKKKKLSPEKLVSFLEPIER